MIYELIIVLYHNLALEVDSISVPWAIAGSNVTIYLAGIDPLQLRYATPLHPLLLVADTTCKHQCGLSTVSTRSNGACGVWLFSADCCV